MSPVPSVSGRATIYWPGDGFCGKWRADGGIFRKTDDHIAHRTLPLGTKGKLCSTRTRACVDTAVRDRGPYGAIRNCTFDEPMPPKTRRFKGKRCIMWQVQAKLKKGWRRRGEFDLTKPVAEAIGHRAFDKVIFYPRKDREMKAHSELNKRLLQTEMYMEGYVDALLEQFSRKLFFCLRRIDLRERKERLSPRGG